MTSGTRGHQGTSREHPRSRGASDTDRTRTSLHARPVLLGEELGDELASTARTNLVEYGLEVLLDGQSCNQ